MVRGASLSRRLLLGAAVFIALAMIVATVAIGFVLRHFVQSQIDQRLDTQIIFLSSVVRPAGDGRIAISGATDGPPFDRPDRGWYWQINGPVNTLRSQALAGADLALPALPPKPPKPPPKPPRPEDVTLDGVRPADGLAANGMRLHFRIFETLAGDIPITIIASAPRAAVLAPLRAALTTLAISLLILGAALVLAMIFQVRLGLRPLQRLRASIADVRSGNAARVPEDQPREVAPVVSELNALLAENAANLERARAHVANLAHGLKTPLATLSLALSTRKRDADDPREALELVALMERRIRHHLGRARMAALSGPMRLRTVIAPRLSDIAEAMQKIHAGRPLSVTLQIDPDLAVACEQQDFDEMAGNLIDNAFKWARSRVVLRAMAAGPEIKLSIEDDGPGLTEADIAKVLQPGARLDETTPGFGFGLPIARELAELYGGSLSLMPAKSGGLAATLTLPGAAASRPA
ncbi:MAG TPA: HAMP domain-containing sensor histidine kinase [Pseudolabrys sp.]|nr:HAMP domain-containing sensor histidine kinase [Pseudolabrys sp.]